MRGVTCIFFSIVAVLWTKRKGGAIRFKGEASHAVTKAQVHQPE
jgi:hypothetical protein